jgi:hypothetical protein
VEQTHTEPGRKPSEPPKITVQQTFTEYGENPSVPPTITVQQTPTKPGKKFSDPLTIYVGSLCCLKLPSRDTHEMMQKYPFLILYDKVNIVPVLN